MDKTLFKNSIAQMKIRHIIAVLYLCVLFSGVTFYMHSGYLNLGEDKYNAYKYIGLIGIAIWLVLRIADYIKEKEYKLFAELVAKWAETKWFIILYLLAAIISTFTSEFWMKAIDGCEGWRIGLIFHVICVFSYFIAEDLIKVCGRNILYPLMSFFFLVCAVAFILTVINRFSIYPIRIKGQEEDFISTLGNINWFCGYWCVWTGVGIGWFIYSKRIYTTLLLGLFVWLCAMSGVCCGADSAYLGFACISFVALMIVLEEKEGLKRWAITQMIAVSSFPCIRISGLFRPNRMWYDNSFLRGITYGNRWIVPFIFVIAICVVVYFKTEFFNKHASLLRSIACGFVGAVIFGFIAIMILNNIILGGIWPVRGKDFFWFNSAWGNGRGGIWMSTINVIKHMDAINLLFGVGCDCFCYYAYSISEVTADLTRQLGDLILTNAHNEVLTMFVNEGIVGFIAYVGVMISHIRTGYMNYKKDGIILGVTLSICAYVLIGMIGFMQVLSTPFLFIEMGIMVGLTNSANLNTIN